MLISVDATGAAQNGAGIVTYVIGLARGWKEAGFDDNWILEGTANLSEGIASELHGLGTVHLSGRSSPLGRFAVQQTAIPMRIRKMRPEVLLCTTPVVPVVTFNLPTVAVVHDLRHLTHPDHFTFSQNLFRRRIWPSGIRRATRLIADSDRTRRDLEEEFPEAASRVEVVHLGSDHVDRVSRGERGGHGIAFARWANKRPDFAIRSWSALKELQPSLDRALHVVGAPAEEHPGLNDLARQLGVGDLVIVHPFLNEEEFWTLFSSAAVVLFPSTFEGFGLPVLEAMRLKIPVVTWRDPAIVEVAGNLASYAAPTPEDFAAQTDRILRPGGALGGLVEAAYERSLEWTWKATAEKTRAVLEKAIDQVQRTG